MNIDVTILMPCLNEEITLEHCINNAKEAGNKLKEKGFTYEVLISDNGSEDNSVNIAESLGARVVHCPNRGYGNAYKFGIKEAYGKYIITGDSDGSYNFIEGVPMIDKLEEGYDLCIGTRLKGEIKPGAMPWKNRYIGNPILSGIMNILFRTGISDGHSGLKALRRDPFIKMNLVSSGMEFTTEVVVKATQYNLKRTELPITLSPDLRDRAPHLKPWSDGWRHLKYMLIFSPEWIFVLPSFIFMIFGIFINILLFSPSDVPRFGMGIHSLVIGDFGFVSGITLMIFGVINHAIGESIGIRTKKGLLDKLYNQSAVERIGFYGFLVMCAGIIILLAITFIWVGKDFGSIDFIKLILLSGTLIASGGITFVGTFLIALLKDNWIKVSQ